MNRNILIDQFDSINSCVDEEHIWECVHRLVEEVGGNHIVNSQISKVDRHLHWFRTSMTDEWISEYLQNDYYDHDTIIDEVLGTSQLTSINGGDIDSVRDPDCLNEVAFNRGLLEAGYGRLMSHSFSRSTDSYSRFVTICFENNSDTLSNVDVKQVISLQNLISIFLNKPPSCSSPGLVKVAVFSLSPREKDVLALLANGFMSARISEKLGVSEAMTNRHIANAKRKLNAATREQAVAIAMASGVISL